MCWVDCDNGDEHNLNGECGMSDTELHGTTPSRHGIYTCGIFVSVGLFAVLSCKNIIRSKYLHLGNVEPQILLIVFFFQNTSSGFLSSSSAAFVGRALKYKKK